jgi:hypothetical protein
MEVDSDVFARPRWTDKYLLRCNARSLNKEGICGSGHERKLDWSPGQVRMCLNGIDNGGIYAVLDATMDEDGGIKMCPRVYYNATSD